MNKEIRGIKFSYIFSGIGIGLLVGILLGLSVSPVVGSVVGGLAALFAAFFGLSERKNSSITDVKDDRIFSQAKLNALRIGSFGFACIIGIILGILIRSHNLLSSSYEDQHNLWKKIGFNDKEARELVAFDELGITQMNWQIDTTREPGIRKASVLFAVNEENCNDLRVNKFKDVPEVLNAWILEGGKWAKFARLIEENIHPENQKKSLEQTWEILCE